jgi:hypothetical protein
MKKLLLTLAAVVGMFAAGSGNAWAETEVFDGTKYDSKNGAVATSVSISSTAVVLGSVNNLVYNLSNTLKLKPATENSKYYITLNVTSGYVVNSISGIGRSNDASKSNTLSAIYVDGGSTNYLGDKTYTFKARPSTNPNTDFSDTIQFVWNDLNATESIKLEFSSTTQIDLGATITYSAAEAPEGAINVTLTNAFNTTSTDWPFTCESAFFTTSGETHVGYTIASVKTLSNVNYKYVQNLTGSKISSASSSAQVQFSLRPKKGLTFVPTSVKFDYAKIGTSGGNLNVIAAAQGLKESTIVSAFLPANSNTIETKTAEISGISCTSSNIFTLTFQPYNLDNNKGVALGNIIVEGYYTGTAEDETLYEVSTTITPNNAGYIAQTPAGRNQVQGTALTFVASPNSSLYEFSKWTDGDGTELSTEKTYKISSLSEDVSLTAVFVAKHTITYKAGGAKGTVPSDEYYLDGTEMTIPANYSLYLEGSTFAGWSDGTTTYKSGDKVALTEDKTLTAVFTENTTTLSDLVAARKSNSVVLNWNFARKSGAPTISYGEGSTGYYVIQTTIDGVTIDVPMTVDASNNGKVNNTSDQTQAQINGKTILSVPVSNGANVKLTSTSGKISTTTINGSTEYSGSGTKVVTYVYSGEDATIDILFDSDGKNYSSVTVTYLPAEYSVAITNLGAATLSLSQAVEIPEDVTAYTGELSSDNATLKLVQVENVIPAGEPVIIFGEPGTYTFPVSSETATKSTTNSLKANLTEAVPTAEEGKTICVLNAVDDNLGFYKLKDGVKLGANKAYLPVPTAAATAPSVRIVFGDETGNVTGIESIAAEQNANAPIFNLAGQKVQGRVAPGLYIQGGKKILVK